MHGHSDITNDTWSGDWTAIKSLIPYFMEFKGRVLLAIAFLILAKLSNVVIPFAMKYIVDALDSSSGISVRVLLGKS